MARSITLSTASQLLAAVIGISICVQASAQLFSDNFDAGPSPLWGNEIGNWGGLGVYSAAAQSNFPATASTLPFVLLDSTLECDVIGATDGGIWLRSEAAPGTAIGRKGVLLVTGGATGTGTGFYWHVIPDGNSYGAGLASVSGLFASGTTIHIRVVVLGDTYSVFLNGSKVPSSTLIDGTFASGRVGLYDFSSQVFDNVVLDGQCTTPPEDLNCDGTINGVDLAIVLGNWGQRGGTGDVNSNGLVDGTDLAIVLGNWS